MGWLIAFAFILMAYYLLHKKVFKPIRNTEPKEGVGAVQWDGRRERPAPLERLKPGSIQYAIYRSLQEGNTAEQILEDPRFKAFKGDIRRYVSQVQSQMDAQAAAKPDKP
jgi:hypothetical protein